MDYHTNLISVLFLMRPEQRTKLYNIILLNKLRLASWCLLPTAYTLKLVSELDSVGGHAACLSRLISMTQQFQCLFFPFALCHHLCCSLPFSMSLSDVSCFSHWATGPLCVAVHWESPSSLPLHHCCNPYSDTSAFITQHLKPFGCIQLVKESSQIFQRRDFNEFTQLRKEMIS